MAQWQRILLLVQETQGMCAWSLSEEDHLEEEMATHSYILAWRIPWTEKLQSRGHKRVGPDLVNKEYHDWVEFTPRMQSGSM